MLFSELPILLLLNTQFGYPEHPLYGSLATSFDNKPFVRTVTFKVDIKSGVLTFFTNITTDKWTHLQNNNLVAISFLKNDYGQIIIHGKANIQVPNDRKLHEWEMKSDEIKSFYTGGDYSKISDMPVNFGMVEVTPHSIELLEINSERWLDSKRMLYELNGNNWAATPLPVIS